MNVSVSPTVVSGILGALRSQGRFRESRRFSKGLQGMLGTDLRDSRGLRAFQGASGSDIIGVRGDSVSPRGVSGVSGSPGGPRRTQGRFRCISRAS